MTGPLAGVRVVDLGVSTTFAAMVLADLSVDVIRLDRPETLAWISAPGPGELVSPQAKASRRTYEHWVL
jgi:crotonobetainyl-CoA:carnitine CoA-transferase CaiB-like acyl-CoA transferase